MQDFESTRTPHGSTIVQFPGHAKPITADDAVELGTGMALYIGQGGDVTVVPADSGAGTPVTFPAVPAGSMLPVRVLKVMGTDTTAGGFVGVW